MTIRLHNLTKWKQLTPGNAIQFVGEHDRRVRVEFNTEVATRLDIVHGTVEVTEITFLGVVRGLEAVEFLAPGGTELVATSEGEVWYFTNEGETTATDREEVSFTKIMNRRARNPELERMMFKMEQNMNARLAIMADEAEARIAAAGVKHDTATGEVDDEAAEDEPGAAPAKPAKKPASGDGSAAGDSKPETDEGNGADGKAKS